MLGRGNGSMSLL